MFTLIGDLVDSRSLSDRAAAQRAVDGALERVNTRLRPVQRLEPTVGDEFQSGFETLAAAVAAALQIRLELLPELDVRCGLGHGAVAVHDRRHPLLQDGPGWWAARDALEVLGERRRAAYRTWYIGPRAGAANAYLTTRDALLARLNDRARRMLLLALTGHTQQQIAALEEISKSAVSQAFSRGVGAVVDAEHTFARTNGGCRHP